MRACPLPVRKLRGGCGGGADLCPLRRSDFLSSHHGSRVKGYSLDSCSLVVKYLGPLSALLPATRGAVALYSGDLAAVWRAMQGHASQFVWFRRLFVLFSRYGFVNTLSPIAQSGKDA